MMRKLILIILILIMVIPASASLFEPETFVPVTNVENLVYNPPSGKIITDVYFYINNGDNITGAIYYGNEQVDYQIKYSRPNFYTTEIYLKLGERNATLTDYDILGLEKTVLLTYATNETTKSLALIYEKGEIFKPSIIYPVEYLEMKPIRSISINSVNPIKLKIGLLSYQTYVEGWETTEQIAHGNQTTSDIFTLDNLLNFVEGSYTLISGFIFYFNLIFIDNGILTFALFESIVLAWSVGTSRSIFTFYRKYIRTHVALFEFLMGIIRTVVDIFYKVIQALKPF